MDVFNIGIIGAGIISVNHFKAAAKMPDVKVKSVADVLFERARDLADEFNIKPYTNYREMMDCEKLDIVIVALPVFLHREAVLEAAARNIHILVEKPMALNVKECQEMIAATQRHGVKFMVGHTQRYYAENIKAYEIMKSGSIGKLIMINDKRYYSYFNDKRPQWCLKRETAGGGVMLNIGAHSVDKVLFMAESPVKKIVGKAGYFAGIDDIEGNGQLYMEMGNGITSVITQFGQSTGFEVLTEYIFTNGIMKVYFPAKIVISSNHKVWEEEFLPTDPFELQLRELINSIEEDRDPKISGEYGCEIVKTITSIY